jgi:hypothetical protein
MHCCVMRLYVVSITIAFKQCRKVIIIEKGVEYPSGMPRIYCASFILMCIQVLTVRAWKEENIASIHK